MAVLVDEQMKLANKRYTRRLQSKWFVRIPDLVVQASVDLIIVICIQQAGKAVL